MPKETRYTWFKFDPSINYKVDPFVRGENPRDQVPTTEPVIQFEIFNGYVLDFWLLPIEERRQWMGLYLVCTGNVSSEYFCVRYAGRTRNLHKRLHDTSHPYKLLRDARAGDETIFVLWMPYHYMIENILIKHFCPDMNRQGNPNFDRLGNPRK